MIGFHILDAQQRPFRRHFSPAQISQLAEFRQRSRMTQEEKAQRMGPRERTVTRSGYEEATTDPPSWGDPGDSKSDSAEALA